MKGGPYSYKGGGVTRVTADSVSGRRMAQAKGARIADDSNIDQAIKAHNDAIEAKRQAELAARKERGRARKVTIA